MSLKYKFEGNNEKEPEKKDDEILPVDENAIELFDTVSSVRNVCFIETNGKETFLNYSYLVSGEFSPDESCITLVFTTHTVKLKGSRLKELHESFMNHQPKKLCAIAKRYAETLKTDKAIISEIEVNLNR